MIASIYKPMLRFEIEEQVKATKNFDYNNWTNGKICD